MPGYPVESMVVDDPMEAAGVNDRHQLAVAEAELRDRINERWMRRGVTMVDPEHTYIDTTVELSADVVLYPGHPPAGQRRSSPAGAELGPDTPALRLHGRAERRGHGHHRAQLPRSAPTPRSARGPTCRPVRRWPPASVTGPCFTGGQRRTGAP